MLRGFPHRAAANQSEEAAEVQNLSELTSLRSPHMLSGTETQSSAGRYRASGVLLSVHVHPLSRVEQVYSGSGIFTDHPHHAVFNAAADSSHAMKDMDLFNGNSEEPTPFPGMMLPSSSSSSSSSSSFTPAGSSELNLIYEVITEDNARSGITLPGPPPPPADLLCHSALTHSHRPPLPHSPPSPTSCPTLVARGTACEPIFSAVQRASCTQMASSHPSRGAFTSSSTSSSSSSTSSSSASPPPRGRGPPCPLAPAGPGRISCQAAADTEVLERVLEKPRLVVVEEPKDRGMRFRYACEGRSAGSILGASSTDTNKTQPAIEIQGCIDSIKRVKVTVSLITKDLPHRPHPHCLVGKDCPNKSGICEVSFNPRNSRRHSFTNLGIQCVTRKDLDVSLKKRRSLNIDPFQTGHTKGIEDMDMNAVRLCFQCELERDDGSKDSLSPVVSKPIYDKKATTTSQLKISQLNQYQGPCTGRTEIFMLCDKVQKDDIEILFRRGSWKANGEFAQTDVHRQIAIVFKTPPYQDQDISKEVEVNVVLRRVSDQMESDPITFTYLPGNYDPYGVKRKRATIKSDVSFKDKPCDIAESSPSSEAFLIHLETQNMATADERLHAAPPTGDMSYCEAQDPNAIPEALLNQLLDIPELWEDFPNPALSSPSPAGFDQAPFANTNMNFNQNFVPYSQDFSQYSDSQFNMMVNENQNPQPAPQDDSVQVKMEEEL